MPRLYLFLLFFFTLISSSFCLSDPTIDLVNNLLNLSLIYQPERTIVATQMCPGEGIYSFCSQESIEEAQRIIQEAYKTNKDNLNSSFAIQVRYLPLNFQDLWVQRAINTVFKGTPYLDPTHSSEQIFKQYSSVYPIVYNYYTAFNEAELVSKTDIICTVCQSLSLAQMTKKGVDRTLCNEAKNASMVSQLADQFMDQTITGAGQPLLIFDSGFPIYPFVSYEAVYTNVTTFYFISLTTSPDSLTSPTYYISSGGLPGSSSMTEGPMSFTAKNYTLTIEDPLFYYYNPFGIVNTSAPLNYNITILPAHRHSYSGLEPLFNAINADFSNRSVDFANYTDISSIIVTPDERDTIMNGIMHYLSVVSSIPNMATLFFEAIPGCISSPLFNVELLAMLTYLDFSVPQLQLTNDIYLNMASISWFGVSPSTLPMICITDQKPSPLLSSSYLTQFPFHLSAPQADLLSQQYVLSNQLPIATNTSYTQKSHNFAGDFYCDITEMEVSLSNIKDTLITFLNIFDSYTSDFKTFTSPIDDMWLQANAASFYFDKHVASFMDPIRQFSEAILEYNSTLSAMLSELMTSIYDINKINIINHCSSPADQQTEFISFEMDMAPIEKLNAILATLSDSVVKLNQLLPNNAFYEPPFLKLTNLMSQGVYTVNSSTISSITLSSLYNLVFSDNAPFIRTIHYVESSFHGLNITSIKRAPSVAPWSTISLDKWFFKNVSIFYQEICSVPDRSNITSIGSSPNLAFIPLQNLIFDQLDRICDAASKNDITGSLSLMTDRQTYNYIVSNISTIFFNTTGIDVKRYIYDAGHGCYASPLFDVGSLNFFFDYMTITEAYPQAIAVSTNQYILIEPIFAANPHIMPQICVGNKMTTREAGNYTTYPFFFTRTAKQISNLRSALSVITGKLYSPPPYDYSKDVLITILSIVISAIIITIIAIIYGLANPHSLEQSLDKKSFFEA